MSMKTYGRSGSRGPDLQDRKQRKNSTQVFFNASNAFFLVHCLATHLKNQLFAQSLSGLLLYPYLHKKRQLHNEYLKSSFLNIMCEFASVSEGMEKEICRFVSSGGCKKGFWQHFMQQFLNSPSLHFLSQQPTK